MILSITAFVVAFIVQVHADYKEWIVGIFFAVSTPPFNSPISKANDVQFSLSVIYNALTIVYYATEPDVPPWGLELCGDAPQAFLLFLCFNWIRDSGRATELELQLEGKETSQVIDLEAVGLWVIIVWL